ncbi:unnamed protein product, partial [Brassica oleracea]
SPFENLYNFLNASTSRLGIPKTATVASRFSAGSWHLPAAKTENQLALQVHGGVIRSGRWYKTGVIYTYLKGSQPTVPWAKIVWISYSIPRHNFLTWLVLQETC